MEDKLKDLENELSKSTEELKKMEEMCNKHKDAIDSTTESNKIIKDTFEELSCQRNQLIQNYHCLKGDLDEKLKEIENVANNNDLL